VSRTGRRRSYCAQCQSEACRRWRQGVKADGPNTEPVQRDAETESPRELQRRADGPGFTARTRANEFALQSGCDASFLLDVACDFIDGLGLEEEFQEDLLAAWHNKNLTTENTK
jgi:hypothetical protein